MPNALIKADRDYATSPDISLYDYQKDAVEFLLTHMHGILVMNPGTGKTLSVLTASCRVMEVFDNVRAVIIAPLSAISSFRKEMANKIRAPLTLITTDETDIHDEAQFALISTPALKAAVPFVQEFTKGHKCILIVDEAHSLQDPKTVLYTGLQALRSCFVCIWCLTATPLLNHMEGMYHILSFVYPGCLGSLSNFWDTYLVYQLKKVWRKGKQSQHRDIIGYKNLESLKGILAKLSFVYSRKYDLRFHYLTSQLAPDEMEAYVTAASGIMGRDEEQGEKDWVARLHDLQRVSDNSYPDHPISKLSGKEKLLLNTAYQIIKRDEAVLVYVEYETTAERVRFLFEKAQDKIGFGNFYQISGSIPYSERVRVEKNMKRGDVVLITKAGSQSLNLQKANNLLIYDIPFSIGSFIQVTGRIARADSEFPFQNVYVLEAEGTIDTYKRKLVSDHAALIAELYGSSSNLPPDIQTLDRKNMAQLRRELLWKTKKPVKRTK